MRLRSEATLDEFRQATRCEWCGRPTPDGCDPHHVMTRGAGGSDIRINLIALCRGYHNGQWVSCHQDFHHGDILPASLWVLVARREQVNFDEMLGAIFEIRALPKGSLPEAKRILRRLYQGVEP